MDQPPAPAHDPVRDEKGQPWQGRTLIDRYVLHHPVGQGGMGTVYLAQDSYLEREVAVKILDAHGLGSEGRGRLLHEARAAARLSHPNVVMVFDLGEEEAAPFVVMEYVPGQTLAEARPQRMDDVIRLARQLCAALQHAHDKDLVHRDVKPQNVLITAEGVAKLTDFGLARALDRPLDTGDGFTGTLTYVAPEQLQGQPVTYAADLYAFGIVLYELATGELPFSGSVADILLQHLQATPPPPRERNARVPPALDELILHLLQKAPEERPASAAEVGHLLGIMSKLSRLASIFELAS